MLGAVAALGAVLLAAPLLGGHLAYLVTGRGWPDVGSLIPAALSMITQPGQPTAGWPAVDGHPPALLVWVFTAGSRWRHP